jgi:hypothetical protein
MLALPVLLTSTHMVNRAMRPHARLNRRGQAFIRRSHQALRSQEPGSGYAAQPAGAFIAGAYAPAIDVAAEQSPVKHWAPPDGQYGSSLRAVAATSRVRALPPPNSTFHQQLHGPVNGGWTWPGWMCCA